jgi:hypothetical protein
MKTTMKTNQGRHSRQAYIIIKIIHLMNLKNADTLAPIMKVWRSERQERAGIVRSHSSSKSWEARENDSSREARQRVGSERLDAGGRPRPVL